MQFIDRISSPLSEPWVSWVLFFLVLTIGWAIQRQPALLRIAWQTSFARTGRNYSDAAVDTMAMVLTFLFRLGCMALTLDILFYNGAEFAFSDYIWTTLILLGVEIIRLIMSALINYTFHLPFSFALGYIQYTHLWLLTSVPLLIINGISIYFGTSMTTNVMLAIVALLLLTAMTIKSIRTCMTHWASFIYIQFYILSLEVIPLIAAAWFVKEMIVE